MALFNSLVWLVGIICAGWVIFDVWAQSKESTGMKVVWTILAVVFSIVTAIVYYFLRKR